MLPGEEVAGFDPLEAGGVHFGFGLGLGHFVEGLDGDGDIFGAVFKKEDAAAGAEGGVDGPHHFPGVGEFVVGIDEEGGVDGVGGKFDAVDGAEVGFDVVEAEFLFALFEEGDHLGLDVDGDDFAFGDERGEAEGVVTGAGADVGDDGVGGEVELGDGARGGFFGFAVVALEPVDGLVAHDVGDLAAHVEFAGAVAAGFARGVAGAGFWRGDGRDFGSRFGREGGREFLGRVLFLLLLGEVEFGPEGRKADQNEGKEGEDEGVALHDD